MSEPSDVIPSLEGPVKARAFLRPIGTPLPLGFLGLTGGTIVLAGLELGWFPLLESQNAALLILAFAAPLQLLASVLGFLARDSVIGAGMGILGGTWLASGLTLLTSLPGATSGALGVLLITAAACLLVPLLSAKGGKLAASAVLGIAAVRFALTGIYELTAVPGLKTAAGVCGVVLGAAGLLAALAFESETEPGRTLLPTLRRGQGSRQLAESPTFQVSDVHHEPGIRRRL